MSQMLSKKQEKIQKKELQKFFNKITNLTLVSKGDVNAPVPDMPGLFLYMEERDFTEAKYYNINQTIENLLDNKYPVLHIKINNETKMVDYSIQDEETGFNFSLISLPATEPLLTFLKVSDYTDKIPMVILGEKKDQKIVFDPVIIRNVMLLIDGYIVE